MFLMSEIAFTYATFGLRTAVTLQSRGSDMLGVVILTMRGAEPHDWASAIATIHLELVTAVCPVS